LIHEILSTSDIPLLSGLAVEKDFVEVPSILFEKMMFSKFFFGKYMKINDDEILNQIELFYKIIRYSSFSNRLLHSLLDVYIHDECNLSNIYKLYGNIYFEIYGFNSEMINDTYVFSHIFNNYDVGYYTYILSDIFATLIHKHFINNLSTIREFGIKLRNIILAPGGTNDSLSSFKIFIDNNDFQLNDDTIRLFVDEYFLLIN
jgi:saccharolysin